MNSTPDNPHRHPDPSSLSDDEVQDMVRELEVALTQSQPGTHRHSQIEAAIDELMAEAERRAAG